MTTQPTPYDVVPYESKPFAHSRPAHLYTIGRLFGMQPPDFRTARVLEIGCASGGNLLPLAALYPDATFLGIDTSGRQIAAGQAFLDELGLTNVALRQLSIAELEEGPFDYIICHGVLSWVDETIQKIIIEKTGRLLSQNGIAYISYNTLPGWNMVRSLREMMQYHTQHYQDPTIKAAQAKLLLTFLRDNASVDVNSPYRQFLSNEINLLSGHPDNYFLHDHLEQHNNPCYFHQFIAMAQTAGLQYLGEAHLLIMFTVNFNQEAQQLLGTTSDILRQEQYMDFLTNRRFRMTLLCHANTPLHRNLTPKSLDGFHLQSLMLPNGDDAAQTDGQRVFTAAHGARIASAHPVTIALLEEMTARQQLPFELPALFESVRNRLPEIPYEALEANWQEWSLSLLAKGGLVLHSEAARHTARVSIRPEAWSFTRAQARHQPWATNLRHEVIILDAFGITLLQYLNGTHTLEELIDKVDHHIVLGELSLQLNGQPVAAPAERRGYIERLITRQLAIFAANALLVS